MSEKIEPIPEEPDMFWDAVNPEYSGDSLTEILDRYDPGEPVLIQRAIRLPDVFAVRVGDEERCFETIEEAEAWAAAQSSEPDDE